MKNLLTVLLCVFTSACFADVNIKVTQVALNTSTGTQDITISGFGVPKAAMFFLTYATANDTATSDSTLMSGFTDGTTSGVMWHNSEDGQGTSDSHRGNNAGELIRVTNAGHQTVLVAAAFSAWITDGVRINITTAGSAYLATVVLIGGTDVSADVGTFSLDTQDTEVDVTSVGFEADLIWLISDASTLSDISSSDFRFSAGWVKNDGANPHTHRGIASFDDTGQGTSAVQGYFDETYIPIHRGSSVIPFEIRDFDSTGFSAFSRTGSNNTVGVHYLALAFNSAVDIDLRTYTTPTSTGNDSVTGLSIDPDFLFVGMSHIDTVETVETDNDGGTHGYGFADDTNEYSVAVASEDGQDTTDTQSITDSKIANHPDATGATSQVATVTLGTAEYTFNHTSANSTARKWWALAIGPATTPAGRRRINIAANDDDYLKAAGF